MYKPLFIPTSTGSTVAVYQCGTAGRNVVAIAGMQEKGLFETTLGDNLAAAAPFGARMTLIDLPGRGNSLHGKLVSMDTWLTDMAEVYLSLVGGRSIWIGSSMGGWLMFLLHERNPQWFSSMCALAPAFDWDRNFPNGNPPPTAKPSELVALLAQIRPSCPGSR